MTTLKLLSAGFVVAAMIASPVMAREGNAKRTNVDAYASALSAFRSPPSTAAPVLPTSALTQPLPGAGRPASPRRATELPNRSKSG
ncbi:hypothetical protein ACVWWR_007049 [Bradyrhizobium sp. LM3.2]